MTDPTWKPMSDLSIDPTRRGATYINVRTYIDVRSVTTYRWLPYKPDGKRQMNAAGRWQVVTEHGYRNCPQPAGEWTPNEPRDVE